MVGKKKARKDYSKEMSPNFTKNSGKGKKGARKKK